MHNGKPNGHANGLSVSSDNIIPFPEPINEDGMWGIGGEYVRLIEHHTEGDRNAILLCFYVMAGNYLGRSFYMRAGADRHYPNLYVCPVGVTGTGRKGSAVSAAHAFFTDGDFPPRLPRIVRGISSGEGLMHMVRDAKYKDEFDKKTGTWQRTIIDPGVTDKRLLVSVGEFQQFIAVFRRQDSITSSAVRQAWDTGRIAAPSKNNEIFVTDAHISIIGCISKDELLQEVNAVDAQNGTLNRFMFPLARRSRLLPEGGNWDLLTASPEWRNLQLEFAENIKIAMRGQPVSILERDDDTQDEWGRNAYPERGLYKQLSQPRIGTHGTVTARAAQQVMRLETIIAAVNGLHRANGQVQAAAMENWRYADDSAHYIFGDGLNDETAARIMQALREKGTVGLSRSEICDLISHKKRQEVGAMLTSLAQSGIAYCQKHSTPGRPVEIWYAAL